MNGHDPDATGPEGPGTGDGTDRRDDGGRSRDGTGTRSGETTRPDAVAVADGGTDGADPDLKTLTPAAVWDADAHRETVATLSELAALSGAVRSVAVHVWGGDWCSDCRRVLPDFAAAVEAAGLGESLSVHPVDREKRGEAVEEYGVERVPTVVVEVDGREVVRFVESAPVPAATAIAEELRESGVLDGDRD